MKQYKLISDNDVPKIITINGKSIKIEYTFNNEDGISRNVIFQLHKFDEKKLKDLRSEGQFKDYFKKDSICFGDSIYGGHYFEIHPDGTYKMFRSGYGYLYVTEDTGKIVKL